MSNGAIIALSLLAAMFLLGGVGAVAYRRIKNASKPGGGVGETLSRLRDELEACDGDAEAMRRAREARLAAEAKKNAEETQ